MIDEYYKNLYLEWLAHQEPTGDGGKTRQVTRHVEVWQNFESILPHKKECDLQYAADGCLADGRYVWVWSDQHFGHKNIIGFSNRPYPNVDLMTECMIGNHNDLVDPSDVCIWVGDVAFLKDDETNEILHQMNGYKILILGNHDLNKKKVKKLHFDEIHLMRKIEVPVCDGRTFDLVFTHYPMHNLPENKVVNIHGHEHVTFLHSIDSPQHLNVNCELHGYKPISMLSIVNLINNRIDKGIL